MYGVYAASAYIVHGNNFLSYCKRALRNLPVNTAIKLTTLRAKTLADAAEQPPYTHVHHPSTVQTKPVFPTSRPTHADVIREDLVPRADWMKDQPPSMSDEEADRTWLQGNDHFFPQTPKTAVELEYHIAAL
jgi:hypothetical protein